MGVIWECILDNLGMCIGQSGSVIGADWECV